jgi:hypothetical protein
LTLRDQILSKNITVKEKAYYWKEMDAHVLLRELTTKEVDALADATVDKKNQRLKKSYNAAKIIASTYDPATGKPVFTAADIGYLSSLPATATQDICMEIELLNMPSKEDVDEAEKNSN